MFTKPINTIEQAKDFFIRMNGSLAETILGQTVREARRGLVYMAYDMGNIPAAKAFIELSLHFSQYDGDDQFGINRSQKALGLCNDIKLELGI